MSKIKKIIPYFLTLLILAGLFGPGLGVKNVQAADPLGTCTLIVQGNQVYKHEHVTKALGGDPSGTPCPAVATWTEDAVQPPGTTPVLPTCVYKDGLPTNGTNGTSCQDAPAAKTSTLEDNLNSCGAIISGTLAGCFIQIVYYVFYGLTSFLLTVAAKFFDIIVALGLSSALYGTFISKAWVVVRDLSNIFFILILLYIAVKIILGLGGSDVKKMIARVIIMALLINFSMFMTEVVVDASNILALIFYNKIDVTVVKKDGTKADINYVATLSGIKTAQDKDIAGALVSRFDPSSLLTQKFFDNVKRTTYEFSAAGFATYVASGAVIGTWIPIPGVGTGVGAIAGAVGYFLSSGETAVPVPLMLGIIVISGLLMGFAAYAFFIAGLAFLSRLIELWILIIFSPFAFMSSAVPLLEKAPYIGWNEWIKKVLDVSFMAPIFMLFLYLIVKIIEADPIGSLADRTSAQQGWMESMLLLIIPAIIILVLLMKGTSFAKKSSGALGDAMLKGAKIVGGFALGAGIGVAAVAGRASIGRAGSAIAESEWAKKREAEGKFGSEVFRSGAKAIGSGSFDVRGVKIAGKGLSSVIPVGEAQKGGFTEKKEEQKQKRMKRAEELKVGKDEKLQQNLNAVQRDYQKMLGAYSHDIKIIDERMKKTRIARQDARAAKARYASGTTQHAQAVADEQEAVDKLDEDRKHKKAIKSGATSVDVTSLTDSSVAPGTTKTIHFTDTGLAGGTQNNVDGTGRSINKLEDDVMPHLEHEIEQENIKRVWAYAKTTESTWNHVKGYALSGGQYSIAGAREAAHGMRTKEKLTSGTKDSSGH